MDAVLQCMRIPPVRHLKPLTGWWNGILARFPGALESEPYRLLQGQSNASVEKGLRLWEMSHTMTKTDTKILAARRFKAAWGELSANLQQACEQYCFDYRENDRARLASLLLLYVGGEVPDPRREVERQVAAQETFVKQTRARLSPDEMDGFNDMLTVALANLPLNEDHNYWFNGTS
jgi:hypothetical protein